MPNQGGRDGCCIRDSHSIEGSLFRLFKWSRDFNATVESPVTPVWIRLPLLPLNFCIPSYLQAIVKPLGKYLDTDLPTITFTRPSYARVCVEIDISIAREDVIWIGSDNGEGFWQEVVYERSPKYCVHCRLHGHERFDCKRLNRQNYNGADSKQTDPKITPSGPTDKRGDLSVDIPAEGEKEPVLNADDGTDNGKCDSVALTLKRQIDSTINQAVSADNRSNLGVKTSTVGENEEKENVIVETDDGNNGSVSPKNLVTHDHSHTLSGSPTRVEFHDVGQEDILEENTQNKDNCAGRISLNTESGKEVMLVEIGSPLNGNFHLVKKGALASPQNMIPTREMDNIPIGNSFDALVDTLNLEAPWQAGGDQTLRPERDEVYHSDSDTPDIRANNRRHRKLNYISDLLVRDASQNNF